MNHIGCAIFSYFLNNWIKGIKLWKLVSYNFSLLFISEDILNT